MPNTNPTLSAINDLLLPTPQGQAREITFASLYSQSDAADADGSVTAFVVTSVTSGNLRIGSNAATATPWHVSSNQLIDATHQAYWTPTVERLGQQNAFTVVAQDNEAAISSGAVQVHAQVEINLAPTITGFSQPQLVVTQKNVQKEIKGSDLLGDAITADSDGTVKALLVDSVNSGTLKIGSNAATAKVWNASTNNVLDATHHAYWTPSQDAVGTQHAFSVRAQDNNKAASVNAVQFDVEVAAVNMLPTLVSNVGTSEPTFFDGHKKNSYKLDFDDMFSLSKAQDRDGTVDAFVVKQVNSGTLLINDKAWNAATNAIINSSSDVEWKPATGALGVMDAFTFVARDNNGGVSVNDYKVAATISLSAPYFNSTEIELFDVVRANNDQTVTFNDIKNGNAYDQDGSIKSFIVTSVSSGTLRIGESAETATAWDANTNNVIDDPYGVGIRAHNAYWTPDANSIGVQNAFTVNAKDDDQSLSAGSSQVKIRVTDVNLLPTISRLMGDIEHVTQNELVKQTFDELNDKYIATDRDGSVDAFVVTQVVSGKLSIGASAASATPWDAVTNNVIDDTRHAYWKPAEDALGKQIDFIIKARDNDGALSTAGRRVKKIIELGEANPVPTFNHLFLDVEKSADQPIILAFNDLYKQSDATDNSGSIDAFVVKEVLIGSLKIGTSLATATDWHAETNRVIDAQHMAFWVPATGTDAVQHAFTVTAIDEQGAESGKPVQVGIHAHLGSKGAINATAELHGMAMLQKTQGDLTYFVASGASVSAIEMEHFPSYENAGITVSREGGPSILDHFFGVGNLTFDNGHALLSGEDIGSVNMADGRLTIIFNQEANLTDVKYALSHIAYQNDETSPTSLRLHWTFLNGKGMSAESIAPVIYGADSIMGSYFTADNLQARNNTHSFLFGDSGNDVLTGSDFDDILNGGVGNDKMMGGLGDDIYVVDAAKDVILENANAGRDTVFTSLTSFTLGENLEDLIYTDYRGLKAKGNDLNNNIVVDQSKTSTIDGGAGDDFISVAGHSATLLGGDGNDTIHGRANTNTAKGGLGDDTIYTSGGNDKVDGGDGNDIIYADSGNNAVLGGKGDDLIYTGYGNDNIDGGEGNDRIYAGAGKNSIKAGAGNDLIDAGSGDDTIDAGDGDDNIFAGEGKNSIKAGLGNDLVYAGGGNDKIDGGAGNDTIYGGHGTNTLLGGAGDDTLVSGNAFWPGRSTLDGGEGNDVLIALADANLVGGSGSDAFVFQAIANTGHVSTIKDFSAAVDTIKLDHLVFSDAGSIGTLLASAFTLGASATTAEHRIIVDTKKRMVSYDDDGNGEHAAQVIANVLGDLNLLTAANFQLI